MTKRRPQEKCDDNVAEVTKTAHSLPFEIIVEVLGFASLLSTKTALSICLVATWTKALGQEGLYGVAVISKMNRLDLFFKSLGYACEGRRNFTSMISDMLEMRRVGPLERRREAFRDDRAMPPIVSWKSWKSCKRPDSVFERATPKSLLLLMVRNLWLPVDLYETTPFKDVLAACKNIANLAIPSICLKHLLDSPTKLSKLQHLTVTTSAFRYDWREGDLRKSRSLCNLTHLFITVAEEDSCYVPMDHLKSLTHLAVPLVTPRAHFIETKRFEEFTVASRFLRYDQLQVVVVHYREAAVRKVLPRRTVEGLIVNANAFNSRLYAMPFNGISEIRGLWKSGARGQDSVWRDAKVVLKHARHAAMSG